MISRSGLVEQLFKDHQSRSRRKCRALTFFSPKPFLTSWIDVIVATFLALLFSVLVVSSYLSLLYRYFRLSFVIISLAVFLPLRLKMSRKAFMKKKERRMLLPLSM